MNKPEIRIEGNFVIISKNEFRKLLLQHKKSLELTQMGGKVWDQTQNKITKYFDHLQDLVGYSSDNIGEKLVNSWKNDSSR